MNESAGMKELFTRLVIPLIHFAASRSLAWNRQTESFIRDLRIYWKPRAILVGYVYQQIANFYAFLCIYKRN